MKSVIFLALSTIFLMDVSILPVKVLAVIYGTRVNAIEHYPYMCGIFTKFNGVFNALCGCAIISPNYALTSATCFHVDVPPGTPYTFFAGSVHAMEGQTREFFTKTDVTIHPNFNSQDTYNVSKDNLAIIKLNPPLNFTDSVTSIRIATGLNDCIYKVDKKFVITGWGGRSTDDAQHDNKYSDAGNETNFLAWSYANPQPAAVCQSVSAGGYNYDSNLCTNKPGAAGGDTGGPLTVHKRNEISYLCGVIGNGSLAHTIYMRVSYYREWICETAENEPTGCCYIGMKIPG